MKIYRPSQPYDEFPPNDRAAIEDALKKGEGLDDDGAFAHWSETTRDGYLRKYGYWLYYLSTREDFDPSESPGSRATRSRVHDYIFDYCSGLSSLTLRGHIWSLRRILEVIDSGADLRYVRHLSLVLTRRAKPSKDQRDQLVAPSDLFYAGIDRMRRHAPRIATHPKAAMKFQDGLMMAMLAAKALRQRNFISIVIGRNIRLTCLDEYELTFEPIETKAQRRISAKMPSLLTPYINLWFEAGRSLLLRGRDSTAMWITSRSTDMASLTFYHRFCDATMEELGRRINPHLVRKIVATGVAIATPELVQMTASLLDQSSDQSAVYNLADQLSASGAYLGLLEKRRQQALKSLGRKQRLNA